MDTSLTGLSVSSPPTPITRSGFGTLPNRESVRQERRRFEADSVITCILLFRLPAEFSTEGRVDAATAHHPANTFGF